MAFGPPNNYFNDSDQTSPTPSGILLSGRGEPAATTAACRHHYLCNQALNTDSQMQQLQRAGAVSAHQGHSTHPPTKQSYPNLQSLAKIEAQLRPPSDNDAKKARHYRPPTLQEYEYDLQRVMGAHQPTTCKPTSATRAFARLDILRMEYHSLNKPCQRTGDRKPQAGGGGYRLHQEASNMASIMHKFKGCQAQRARHHPTELKG